IDVCFFDEPGFVVDKAVVAGIEVEFFRVSGRGAAPLADMDIVIEAVAIDDAPAGAAAGSGGRYIAGEPVPGRDAGGKGGVVDLRSEVFRRVVRVGKGRRAGRAAVGVGGDELPADDLSGGKGFGGNDGPVDAVARGTVAVRPVVRHRRLHGL